MPAIIYAHHRFYQQLNIQVSFIFIVTAAVLRTNQCYLCYAQVRWYFFARSVCVQYTRYKIRAQPCIIIARNQKT